MLPTISPGERSQEVFGHCMRSAAAQCLSAPAQDRLPLRQRVASRRKPYRPCHPLDPRLWQCIVIGPNRETIVLSRLRLCQGINDTRMTRCWLLGSNVLLNFSSETLSRHHLPSLQEVARGAFHDLPPSTLLASRIRAAFASFSSISLRFSSMNWSRSCSITGPASAGG